MQVDVMFDTVCPWCFVGKRRLEAAFRLRPHLSVKPNWRPFLLNPDMPREGMDRTAYLARKFGSESRVRRIYGAIADAGQSVDIDFAFDRIRRTPNSVNSHRLIRFAGATGRAESAVEALFLNYFINGRNIGDIGVLLKVGTDLGLDAEALAAYLESDDDIAYIHEENARAHRMAINSVPTYVFNGTMVISGAHDPQVLARMLDTAVAAAA